MNREEALELAGKVRDGLPWVLRQRLKAIHVSPHAHQGHTTVRIFTVPQAIDDPEPFIFTVEELP
mgnify:FL=1